MRSSFDWAAARRLVLGAVVLTALSAWLLPGRSQAAAAENVTVTLSPGSIVANGSSTSTATATVTKGSNHPSGRTVVFSSSDTGIHFSATVYNGNGSYTATLTSSTVAGTATITATDTTPAQPVAGQATLTKTAGPATKIALSLDPGTIGADGASYSTATATLSDAFGNPVPADNVVFSSSDPGESVLQVTSNGNGTYSALIRSSTTPGQATITATDASVNLSAEAELTQAVGASILSLVPFPSAPVTNEGVTLLAVLNGAGGSSGTITFANDGAPIAGCVDEPIGPSSPAACQISFAASTSPEQLTAAFTPDAGSSVGSSTARATVNVGPDSTSTSLDVSKTVSTGTRTTYTASVRPPANRPGPIQASGSVQFFDGGRAISSCTTQPLINGGATCTVAYGSTGRHSITASYGGDANFTGSTSSSQAVDVVALPPRVLGIITSTMQWSFYYTSQYTRVLSLMVNGVPAGATVHVTCHGRGCPFAKHVAAIAKTRRCGLKGKPRCATNGKINLASGLRKHPLHVGARLAVQITRPGWIGKSYLFAMRRSRGPRVQIACLAPRGTRPGVSC